MWHLNPSIKKVRIKKLKMKFKMTGSSRKRSTPFLDNSSMLITKLK